MAADVPAGGPATPRPPGSPGRCTSAAWRADLYERAPQAPPADLAAAVAERETLLVTLRDLEGQLASGGSAPGEARLDQEAHTRRTRLRLAHTRLSIRYRFLKRWITDEVNRRGAPLPWTRGAQPDLLTTAGALLVRLVDREPALLDALTDTERATLGAVQEWLAARTAGAVRSRDGSPA